jgi:NACHT domain
MSFLNPKLGIDFSAYIADRANNYTGRQWVFEEIQRWLVNPQVDRFLLVTGEPGSGKTAIAARLAQFAQGIETFPGLDAGFLDAAHFCSARDSLWTDPKEFTRSLALQLAASIPEFALALKDIGEKTTNINVDMSIGTVQNSDVKGVVIQNLMISGLTGQEAFTQVVVNPLRQIQQEGFNKPVTILVDSLDEALTHDGESTIVSLIAKMPTSIGLRLILTSRNEGRVKDQLSGYQELFLSSLDNIAKNQQDVREYTNNQFRVQEALQTALQAASLGQEVLTNSIVEKSEGNFLYVKLLLESVALGQHSLVDLDGLPNGLDELYYKSFGRVIELGGKDWSEVYAPIMGVLLAAQESLTEKQIRYFTKLKESIVWNCLIDLQQFLDEIQSDNEETLYKFYHQSVADFLGKKQLLLDKKKSNNRYYLPEQEQHQRVLENYRVDGQDWDVMGLEKVDPYGRKHLAQHLVKADRVEELHSLLNLEKDGKNAWFKLKDDEGDIFGFLADVNLAWVQADGLYDSDQGKSIGLQCRYALIKTSVNSLAQIPKELMLALVKHSYWKPQKAFAYTFQISDAEERFERLKSLAEQLPDSEIIKEQLWASALQAAQSIEYECARADALVALSDKLSLELLTKAIESAEYIEYEEYRVRALTSLKNKSPIVSVSDPEIPQVSPASLPQALEAAQAIGDRESCSQVLVTLSGFKSIKFADKLPDLLSNTLANAEELEASQLMDDNYDSGDRSPRDPKTNVIEQSIQDKYNHIRELMGLIDKSPDILPTALEAVQTIKDEPSRALVITVLIANLAIHPDRFNLWKNLLHFLSYQNRPGLLNDIKALIPMITALGEEVSITETARAIQDVSHWWP